MKPIHLKARLGRRRRKQRLGVSIVVLLALSALAGWLLWLVLQRAAVAPISGSVISPGPVRLAMAPLPLSAVYAVCWTTGALVLVCLGMALWHSRREKLAELRWAAAPTEVGDPLDAELRCLIGMTDAVAILQSCETLLCEAEEKMTRHVTREGLGVENYDETLHLAVQDVRSAHHCLMALRGKLTLEDSKAA